MSSLRTHPKSSLRARQEAFEQVGDECEFYGTSDAEIRAKYEPANGR